ncbi:MAG: exodeoxyribonuclease III [Alphaproteobacteria bacterium]|nr:exodeoxyribonuclease III [Alphaproteobacteria bacterium]
MRILTWNINSVRLRIGLLERLVAEQSPDIVCLQETKVDDGQFPREAVAAMGLPHQAIHGQKSYNGVAILSRLPLEDVRLLPRAERLDCRHLAARVAGIDLHCLYIPSGGDVPDPAVNDKFAHKLAFLDDLIGWLPTVGAVDQPMLMCGDFNIAPMEHDVWSHKQLLDVVSHTPVEVDRLARVQATLDWVDVSRHFVPAQEKLYSWWSYRAKDWSAADRGRRLDHIWVTPPLAPRLTHHAILRDVRGWSQASDHVPVVVDLA